MNTIPSAWDILQPHTAWLEQDCVQPHHGTALPPAPVSAPLSPFPEAFHRFQHSIRLFPPLSSPAGNVLLKEFSPGWSGGLAVFSVEVPCGWAVLDQALLGFRGTRFLEH